MSNVSSWNRIWKTIHIIGKTFDPTKDSIKESFVCFFECLVDLLPDNQARRTLASFMQQPKYSLERIDWLSSSDKTFEWTYRLHSYVNHVKKKQGQLASDITLEQAYKIYSKDNIKYSSSNSSEISWGNEIWFLIHYIAANLPDKVSQQQAISFKAFIVCIRYLIPCEKCNFHMNNYISDTEINPYLSSGSNIFYWTWQFHNAVNERLKKPFLKIEDAYGTYRKSDSIYTLIDY